MSDKDETTLHITITRARFEQLERLGDRKGIKQASVMARLLIYEALDEELNRQ